ncbi:MAG: two-component system response regulator FixJ [Parasphingorhabdus sp.]|jgi:FixJ family two-component response regulator
MGNERTVFIIDDDEGIREGLSLLLSTVGQACQIFSSALEFLEQFNQNMNGCLVLDIRMPEMSGLQLQEKLNVQKSTLPIIFITGHGDVPMAVEAMRCGALGFIRKPFREQDLLDNINEALALDTKNRQKSDDRHELAEKIELLSQRERAVFEAVTEGDMNKVIAADLSISERTVEVHRAQIMKKLGVRTLAQLVRIKVEVELL